ncbi:MAG TPA: sigma-70 family RNA polymerase sigma factor [Pyrinomonadaceae bacterium]|jgi:RNA polymerase sigma factor, sigma-70 family|nr:sigma-70 family RNA polymerase sigma factor [Pyrinomonadaceae bacterium]
MKKDWVVTQESFDALLAWLDPNRERAAERYEDIRSRLIKLFTCRGCYEPEDLADETINRVIKRLKDIEASFTGDPTRYFYGVANNVHKEYLRRKPVPQPPIAPESSEQIEREYECLERCMEELTADNRQLVLQYYQREKRARIDHRKQLAQQLGIALNALRIRAHRLRTSLQECLQNCLEEAPG